MELSDDKLHIVLRSFGLSDGEIDGLLCDKHNNRTTRWIGLANERYAQNQKEWDRIFSNGGTSSTVEPTAETSNEESRQLEGQEIDNIIKAIYGWSNGELETEKSRPNPWGYKQAVERAKREYNANPKYWNKRLGCGEERPTTMGR